MTARSDQEELLDTYVATFPKLDEMTADELLYPIAWQLAVGKPDEIGFKRWRPINVDTDPSMLAPIYAKLPARFPGLFERLVLSYRWAEVDLGTYRLLPNPPGPDLSGLFGQILKDPGLWEALLPAGLIQFGMGPDLDYDPVCFDVNSRKQGGDCRIVKIDHEEILCNNRIRVVGELAPSFYQLVIQTIERANQAPRF